MLGLQRLLQVKRPPIHSIISSQKYRQQKKVAIVGAGIVGATTAYYLSKEADVKVTVYDHGLGQATKAAAGIISPWFSKRRNKAWYKMARLGADFYIDLLNDLQESGQEVDFYQRSGVFLLKKMNLS